MRKITHILTSLFVLAFLSACTENGPSVLTIAPAEVTLNLGETSILQLTGDGKEIVLSAAQWVSTDSTVVYVTAGIIQGMREGMAIVTARYQQAKAECIVTVTKGGGSSEDLSAAVRYLPKSPKRGVSYNFTQFPEEDVEALSPYISWCYNWGTQPSSAAISDLLDAHHIDYIPMAWNGVNEAQIRAYKESHPQCEYILAFNEPNLTDQAHMTPQQAADKWPSLKNLADELGLKIVSPAMNYGTLSGYSDPVKWLDEFFQLVPKTDVCAIALHCYMGSAGAMYSYIRRFDKYDLPIWMTEFCAWDKNSPSSVEAQTDYMNEAVIMLEADPKVARYAWFIPRASGAVDSYPYMQLLSKKDIGELSPQGQIFAAISSLNTQTWLSSENPILPNTFSNCSAAETIRSGAFENAPRLRASTDCPGELTLCNLTTDKWVEYQIEVMQPKQQLVLRYQAVTGSKLAISVDGMSQQIVSLPWSDSQWETKEINLPIEQGKHTLRLSVTGNLELSWFKFQE